MGPETPVFSAPMLGACFLHAQPTQPVSYRNGDLEKTVTQKGFLEEVIT